MTRNSPGLDSLLESFHFTLTGHIYSLLLLGVMKLIDASHIYFKRTPLK
jgi:hypothetical protein